jgi:Na+/melibiose symporter-like transporter
MALVAGLVIGLGMLVASTTAARGVRVTDAAPGRSIRAGYAEGLAAPLWGRIANRVGKERGFVWASILFGVAALSLLGLLWAPGDWVYIPVALAGAAYAGMQSLPMAMLPDVISDDAATHGDGQAGTFGGMWTAGETTGMALGATVLTAVLAIAGYAESTADTVVVQSPAAIAGIVLSFSVVPAAIIGLSLLSLARSRLRKGTIGR